jgi:hypothetical protein
MTNRIKVSKSDKSLKKIVEACYPEWRGRKLHVEAATSYQLSNYWSEGSRDYVRAFDLASGKIADTMRLSGNPFTPEAHARVEIPEGVVFVEHSIFCGKDRGVTIYVNPANMPKFLPEAA